MNLLRMARMDIHKAIVQLQREQEHATATPSAPPAAQEMLVLARDALSEALTMIEESETEANTHA